MDYFLFLLDILKKKQVYGVILVIAFSFLIYKFLLSVVKKIVIKGKTPIEIKRRKTIQILFENIILYVIFIIAILIILEIYGVDTKSLIASLGVAGVVLGLALQDTVKDIISGITIIMENYFVVGDYVTFGDFTGEIISLGLKSTKIKSINGDVLIIANRNISNIINQSQKLAGVIIDVPTAYEEKTEKVEKVLKEAIEQIKLIEGVSKESTYLGINELGSSAVNYRIKIVCRQGRKYDIKYESLKIIKQAYDKNKLKIPYEQIEVHNGKDI